MEIKQTERGFDIIEFTDEYGEKCSLQKSSLATEDCIWFGLDEIQPRILIPNVGWVNYPIHPDVHISSRMHLTQEQVKELLPYLIRFSETGEIGEYEHN